MTSHEEGSYIDPANKVPTILGVSYVLNGCYIDLEDETKLLSNSLESLFVLHEQLTVVLRAFRESCRIFMVSQKAKMTPTNANTELL